MEKEKFTRSDYIVLTACCLGQFLVILDASIINVALPTLKNVFNFDSIGLQWVVNSYTLLFAAMLLVGGLLADTFGSKKVLVCGSIVFGLASGFAGIADTPLAIVVCRAIQGGSAGIIAPATLSIIAIRFGRSNSLRGIAFGTWSAVASAGGAAGVIFGGLIAQYFSWEWIFWINIPVVILLLVLTLFNNDDYGTKVGTYSLLLKSVGATSLGAFSLFLIILSALTFSSGTSLILGMVGLAISAVLMKIFWTIQIKISKPVIPNDLLRSKSTVIGNVTALVGSGSIFMTYYFLTLFMRYMFDYSPLETGFAYLPMTLAMFFSAKFVGTFLVNKYSSYNINILGLLMAGSGLFFVLFAMIWVRSYFPALFIGVIILGIGQGVITTTSSMLGTEDVDRRHAGAASAVINASRQVGGALSLGIVVAVLETVYSPVGDILSNNSTYVYALFAASTLPILLSFILILNRPKIHKV